ncbi:MAG: hypothetical protein BJ554DRAFT_1959 [Olpidium bornovanus]|uniref:Uncharacterized protein n=1 Tax=Olpidium bornovanus TaxID=278681 RepID=A0A8H8DLS3_9FUNG|nr:MAG: hypothetical protein BJ554DRAFT_1959 [Olpidium bornovanus]
MFRGRGSAGTELGRQRTNSGGSPAEPFGRAEVVEVLRRGGHATGPIASTVAECTEAARLVDRVAAGVGEGEGEKGVRLVVTLERAAGYRRPAYASSPEPAVGTRAEGMQAMINKRRGPRLTRSVVSAIRPSPANSARIFPAAGFPRPTPAPLVSSLWLCFALSAAPWVQSGPRRFPRTSAGQ